MPSTKAVIKKVTRRLKGKFSRVANNGPVEDRSRTTNITVSVTVEEIVELHRSRAELSERLAESQSHLVELTEAMRTLQNQLHEVNTTNRANINTHAHTHAFAMYIIQVLQAKLYDMDAELANWQEYGEYLQEMLYVHRQRFRDPAGT